MSAGGLPGHAGCRGPVRSSGHFRGVRSSTAGRAAAASYGTTAPRVRRDPAARDGWVFYWPDPSPGMRDSPGEDTTGGRGDHEERLDPDRPQKSTQWEGGMGDSQGARDPGEAERSEDDDSRADVAGENRAGDGAGEDAAGDETDEDAPGDEMDDPSLAAILGAEDEDLPARQPLVPERPSPEHVLFVLLGVLLGVYVVWRAAAVFTP